MLRDSLINLGWSILGMALLMVLIEGVWPRVRAWFAASPRAARAVRIVCVGLGIGGVVWGLDALHRSSITNGQLLVWLLIIFLAVSIHTNIKDEAAHLEERLRLSKHLEELRAKLPPDSPA